MMRTQTSFSDQPHRLRRFEMTRHVVPLGTEERPTYERRAEFGRESAGDNPCARGKKSVAERGAGGCRQAQLECALFGN
jgi:hypothetical protein